MGLGSILGSISRGLGEVLGFPETADSIADLFDPNDLAVSQGQNDIWNAGAMAARGESPSSGFDLSDVFSSLNNRQPSIWPSLIQGGLGLVGTGMQQSAQKDLSEMYAEQAAAQIAHDKEMEEKRLQNAKDIAQIYAGSQAGSARKNTLANLYSNWASLTSQAGQGLNQGASKAASGITDSLKARAAVLK